MNRFTISLLLSVVIALISFAPIPITCAQALELHWRVHNPFRLFRNAHHTDTHRQAMSQLTMTERARPIFNVERRLAASDPHGWADTIYKDTCWNRKLSAYNQCTNELGYAKPSKHLVNVHLEDEDGLRELAFERCIWRITPYTDGGNSSALTVVDAACGQPVRLSIPYPAGAFLSVESAGIEIGHARLQVRDIFIVSLGDSFASGDGNPDEPVRFSDTRSVDYGLGDESVPLIGYPTRLGTWRNMNDHSFHERGARWLSQSCHRSLYSHPVRVALQLALEEPHRSVTFASFACAGAEITSGLFLNDPGNKWIKNPPKLSQLGAAAELQCGMHAAREVHYAAAFSPGSNLKALKGISLKRCSRSRARPIDLVLLSIGGNDIGFSRFVANTVLAERSILRSLGGWMGKVHGASQAMQALSQLPLRYKVLNRALHNVLHIPWHEANRIILSAYPTMAVRSNGNDLCPDGRAGMGVYPEFYLNQRKARQGELVTEALHQTMERAAMRHHWTFAEAHRSAFAGHSICAGADEIEIGHNDDIRLPRVVDGRWYPFRPSAYQPYATRRRWYRTPNDAYMTGHFHAAQSLVKKLLTLKQLSWFQLVLASTYSGAFHPTAEGQAVIADSVLSSARQVLARYSDDASTVIERGYADR